ncbi:MAG: transposase [Pseudomonas sp.]|uniref:IS110 family transposase n=1 Tax=Pseudomonas sp. TaxID=306 RepID=UPI00299DDB8E|nr:transposase [Pseudomonas sp.]MDX1724492.1 transposase [Pseudomonas sp.]
MSSIVGIDIAKHSFDIATLQANGKYRTKSKLANEATGFQTLQQWLAKYAEPSAWIVMEATGVYHEALAEYLHQLVLPRVRHESCADRPLRPEPVTAGQDGSSRRQVDC